MIHIPELYKPENFTIRSCANRPDLRQIQKKNLNDFTIVELRRLFYVEYLNMFNRRFECTKESNELLYTILCYFFKSQSFFDSPCLIIPDNTSPNFSKGLLIMGNTGIGKTSIFLALEKIFKEHIIYNPKIHFKSMTAHNAVNEFEKVKSPDEKDEFFSRHNRGFRFYDDVKSEDDASNFGKQNLFKKILHQRNEKRLKTIITCNFASSDPDNFQKGLEEFGTRYDERIYDRLFSDFNFILANGTSLRR